MLILIKTYSRNVYGEPNVNLGLSILDTTDNIREDIDSTDVAKLIALGVSIKGIEVSNSGRIGLGYLDKNSVNIGVRCNIIEQGTPVDVIKYKLLHKDCGDIVIDDDCLISKKLRGGEFDCGIFTSLGSRSLIPDIGVTTIIMHDMDTICNPFAEKQSDGNFILNVSKVEDNEFYYSIIDKFYETYRSYNIVDANMDRLIDYLCTKFYTGDIIGLTFTLRAYYRSCNQALRDELSLRLMKNSDKLLIETDVKDFIEEYGKQEVSDIINKAVLTITLKDKTFYRFEDFISEIINELAILIDLKFKDIKFMHAYRYYIVRKNDSFVDYIFKLCDYCDVFDCCKNTKEHLRKLYNSRE